MKITLCGSARFEWAFKEANKRLSLAGHVVHTLSVYPSDESGKEWYTDNEKWMLDQVHLCKIDMSDAILVIAPGGYVGESTRKEIDFARKRSKAVYWSIEEVLKQTKKEGNNAP